MSVVPLSSQVLETKTPGFGYIAGESPDGLVTIDNVPSRAILDLFDRSTLDWLRRSISSSDGTYRFAGLSAGRTYNIVGRDIAGVFEDVIVSRVQPYLLPTLAVEAFVFTHQALVSHQLEVQYGAAPFAWGVDALPPGLTLSVDGLLSGTPTATGEWLCEVVVTDAYGEAATAAVAITVAA